MNFCKYIKVGKTGPLVLVADWLRVKVYCSKLFFCQNNSPINALGDHKDSLLQHIMTLLQGLEDPVLSTLMYKKISLYVFKRHQVYYRCEGLSENISIFLINFKERWISEDNLPVHASMVIRKTDSKTHQYVIISYKK